VVLSEKGCISKLASRRSSGVVGLYALEDEAVRQHLDMQLDFVFEFVAGPSPVKEPPKPCREQANPDRHGYFSPCRLSTRAMMPENRSQFSVSTASCLRPLLVIE
jgi:hypothetical protein